MKNLVVIFQAKTEHAEALALALGLGAVQRGCDIRLRHLNPSLDHPLAHQAYGTLKPSDLAWAECLAILLEGRSELQGLSEDAASGGIPNLLSQLEQATLPQPSAAHKSAFLYSPDPPGVPFRSVQAALLAAGFHLVSPPAPESMTATGQFLAGLSS